MQQITNENIKEILSFITPAVLSYQEWVNIGMALKDEGFDSSVWDEWSQNDTRYHNGESERKWKTFNGSSSPVTIATVMQMAFENGYRSGTDSYELDWDSEIGGTKDDFVIVDKNWIESKEIKEPAVWNPAAEIIKYLETLFDSTETVGYVTETWEKDGKFMPSKGSYTHTAGELIQELGKHKDDIGAVIGDYNKSAGAWVRFNPLDGKGVKNENVTDSRYALVESDTMEIDKQNAVIRELELPVAALVYSGKKSLHAIVRIEAANYDEYRKRVDYLYKAVYTCSKCSDSYTEVIPATGHKIVVDKDVAATCTETGLTGGEHCSVCGKVLQKQEVVEAKGHNYQNGICVDCGDNVSERCNCQCHKGGIGKLVWKIIRIFYKLFRLKPICKCGVKHY